MYVPLMLPYIPSTTNIVWFFEIALIHYNHRIFYSKESYIGIVSAVCLATLGLKMLSVIEVGHLISELCRKWYQNFTIRYLTTDFAR